MKTTILSFTLAAIMLGTVPAMAGGFGTGSHIAGVETAPSHDADVFERRGRGRGSDDGRSHDRDDDRGGDRGGRGRHGGGGNSSDDGGGRHDSRDDNDRDRAERGHGGRPRIPGGSGCDDAGDVQEHAACRR